MSNIIEYIDSCLPQDVIDIYYLELPDKKDGLLIEETGVRGRIDSFNGYDGVIGSTIQFFVRVKEKDGVYKRIPTMLKQFYKLVQKSAGSTKESIKLLFVDSFELSELKDDKENYIFSLMFSVIYKELE